MDQRKIPLVDRLISWPVDQLAGWPGWQSPRARWHEGGERSCIALQMRLRPVKGAELGDKSGSGELTGKAERVICFYIVII